MLPAKFAAIFFLSTDTEKNMFSFNAFVKISFYVRPFRYSSGKVGN